MTRRKRLNRLAASAGTAAPKPRTATAALPAPADLKEFAQQWAPTVARLSLGLVLLWFGVHELVQPGLWTGYVPVISQASRVALGMVLVHGWLLCVLGVALVLGVAPQLAAVVSALLLFEIILSLTFTGGLSDIVARDVGVFGLALAVFGSNRQRLILRG